MKFSPLLTAIVVVALVVVAMLLPKGWREALWQAGYVVFGPVVETVGSTSQVVREVQTGLATLEDLEKEVARLRTVNAKLETELTIVRDLAEENARLRELLGFQKASRYRLMAARVVARDPSNWWSTVLINRGFVDDAELRSDLPVVTARGVVGKTGSVSRDVTEVILLSNQNCRISAYVENSREQGILVGDGEVDDGRPRARLTYVSRNAQLAIGERVFSSGLGGVFPPGLMLGTIYQVPPLSPRVNFGLYREVIMEPTVDLTHVDEVFVILGQQPQTPAGASLPAVKERGKR